MHEELDRKNGEKLGSIAELLEVTDTLLAQRVRGSMDLLREYARGLGVTRLGETVAVGDLRAPDLLLGDHPQANGATLVDTVTALMGGTAILFVRSGDDSVRVSTDVKRSRRPRATQHRAGIIASRTRICGAELNIQSMGKVGGSLVFPGYRPSALDE